MKRLLLLLFAILLSSCQLETITRVTRVDDNVTQYVIEPYYNYLNYVKHYINITVPRLSKSYIEHEDNLVDWEMYHKNIKPFTRWYVKRYRYNPWIRTFVYNYIHAMRDYGYSYEDIFYSLANITKNVPYSRPLYASPFTGLFAGGNCATKTMTAIVLLQAYRDIIIRYITMNEGYNKVSYAKHIYNNLHVAIIVEYHVTDGHEFFAIKEINNEITSYTYWAKKISWWVIDNTHEKISFISDADEDLGTAYEKFAISLF